MQGSYRCAKIVGMSSIRFFGGSGRVNPSDVTTSRPRLLARVVTNAHAKPVSLVSSGRYC